ncbi:cellulase family glycosylhydrolase [uncultured Algibacter sp.]|uniref:cellulase family glycosylhydrolase n=1 Tax=uncultured Algibacter sp. TaxID=298659 RepID=UPI0026206ADA|nr:cellulase family glycosylhydrolase [uncultured Algibacter sp.]
MGINKNILRGVLVLSYIVITAILILGIGSIYSYLNTGADRSNMLHTEIKKIEQYLPKIEWAPIHNEGRAMDSQTLATIETDYLDAWYVKHIAYKTNTTKGIDDYYTENARQSIFDIISKNKADSIYIDGTTLEHHLNLDFFSEDGQLAVLTDSNVIEYKRVYKNDLLVLETKEQSTYRIILLLEDGFWRIRHLIKQQSVPYVSSDKKVPKQVSNIRGINYYPQATPWDMYGDGFDETIINADFNIIKNAGLNTIRIFVPYDDFDKANINPKKLEKLNTVLDLAQTHQLKVMVTLFDFYGDYSVINWSLNQHHVLGIVSALQHHDALFAWDIKNEPNLDFDSRGKTLVTAWLKEMIATVKSVDTIHPVTIGWSNAASATLLTNQLDFVSFHYYDDLSDLDTTFKTLKTELPNTTIAITEFGMSSNKGLWHPLGNSEDNQAEYYKDAQKIFKANNISFMSWTLYDFTEIPKEVVGRLPWRKQTQEHFGFIDQNGETKPAFKYISKE